MISEFEIWSLIFSLFWLSNFEINFVFYAFSRFAKPNLSKTGQLGKKICICLQEESCKKNKGKVGPIIAKEIEECEKSFPNIHVEASASGKFETRNVRGWFQKTLEPDLKDGSVLLLDSYGCHNEGLKLLTEKSFELKIIPKRTTKWIQALDVFFFGQYKFVSRRMFDWLRAEYFDENGQIVKKLGNRRIILKFQSLIYNLFQAEVFRPMSKYSWIKPNYTEADDSYSFLNAYEILFKNLKDCSMCDNISCLTCPHCFKQICFDHWFNHYHFHPVG